MFSSPFPTSRKTLRHSRIEFRSVYTQNVVYRKRNTDRSNHQRHRRHVHHPHPRRSTFPDLCHVLKHVRSPFPEAGGESSSSCRRFMPYSNPIADFPVHSTPLHATLPREINRVFARQESAVKNSRSSSGLVNLAKGSKSAGHGGRGHRQYVCTVSTP